MLSIHIDIEQKNWDETLPFITICYSTTWVKIKTLVYWRNVVCSHIFRQNKVKP